VRAAKQALRRVRGYNLDTTPTAIRSVFSPSSALPRLRNLLAALPRIAVGKEELDRHNHEAHLRVMRSSNAFMRKLLNSWIVVATILCLYVAVALPEILFTSLVALASAVAARYAIHLRRMQWARWLFVLPMTVAFFVVPPLVNGIRSPVLIYLPLFVLLYGWLFGRRIMALMTALYLAGLSVTWLAEQQNWWVMSTQLRSPETWLILWVILLCLTALTTGALISSYQAHSRSEVALRGELASVLQFTESVLLSSPLPMRVFDEHGQCIKVNEAYARLVGVPRETLLTQNFHAIEMWQAAGLVDDSHVAMRAMTPLNREVSVHTSTGRDLWLDVHLLPLDSAGRNSLLVQLIDLTERKQMSRALEAMAFHDALTQLPNRRLFFDRFDHALHKGRRTHAWGAVLLLDLDRFKELNDTHGHDAGDPMLCAVADRLRAVLRESDTAARLGGDEFAVLAENLGPDHAIALAHAERLTAKLRDTLNQPYRLGALTHHGTASIGCELFSAEELRNSNEVLQAADAAMYAAKGSGSRRGPAHGAHAEPR